MTSHHRHRGFEKKGIVRRLEMVLQSQLESADLAELMLSQFSDQAGCTEQELNDISLAVRECVANAVIHGCKNNPGKVVEVCVACDEARGMLIVVRDPGSGFDFEKVKSPLMGQNVYSDHGRGIYLINQFMDEVKYERGGTEIHMRKF